MLAKTELIFALIICTGYMVIFNNSALFTTAPDIVS